MATAYKVATRAGDLTVHAFEPPPAGDLGLTVITVHPWAPLGGGEHNTVGIAEHLSRHGLRGITFQLRSSFMVWGVLSNHRSEVAQIEAVVNWAHEKFGRTLLLGSSAGAPMAGSALDRGPAVGLACIGYTWGWLSSVALGRHYGRVRRSAKPKLFLQGERDEFTAPELLHSTARRMDDCEKCIFKGVGHFDLEHSSWDAEVVRVIRAWVGERFLDEGSAPRDEAGQLVCMDAAEHAARGRA